ncbi:MAG: amidase [Acidobacteriales bacterium]|nr:amidase [Terriglobales bacterium]
MEKFSNNATKTREAAAVDRRKFMQLTALAGAGASLAGATVAQAAPVQAASAPKHLNEVTIAELQAAMASRRLSSVELTTFYLNRILAMDQRGPGLNSVIEINPDALAIAKGADTLRRQGIVLGPLHGIPVLLKDNIDTGDKMQTSAGSFALVGQPAVADSTVAAKLRAGGAVILGKCTLSEWANFRGFASSSGWSGRGGQCNNPYAIDRNPCGSSSGSGAAASANLAGATIGSETDGSIVCPSSINGVVGIKPTVGLVSRAGVVPISQTQDTVGPHARTVADAAAVLGVIVSQGFDGRDAATGGVPLGRRGISSRPAIPTNYTQFLDPDGLDGARIGVMRLGIDGASPKVAAVFDQALAAMEDAGATLVDVTFPHQDVINSGANEFTVLLFDFKIDLRNYFATRLGVPMAGKTLADAIAFNIANADRELQFFGQEIFELAELFDVTDPDAVQPLGVSYNDALTGNQTAGAVEGFDLLIQQENLHAFVAPTGSASWPTDLVNGDHFIFGSSSHCAIVGYPIINVPMGSVFGLPVGISFMGTAFSEPTLIKLASGFENVVHGRTVPQFFRTLPLGDQTGPHLSRRQRRSGHNKPNFI